ncbi:TATA box-binding protein-associated factor RNA polymerase I subunit B [Diorhabda carinulata]|uniref:TATA box-binding protein-associated factor RNA polymerase I subunit B n=1 Tax=Diorhabda carinulata TaxID=1163345 RepID=UPI0025A28EEF|nr:TATA box-binding protein-associated factor RNA polymerase I subunit B [Diorhabda carinulata]
MECVVCGGTQFTKESGFYFCNECQTQSQEIKEHAFQEEDARINVKTTRKVKSETSKDEETKNVTSWECYNVIMLMVTEELVNLGVDRSIKNVVKCLWMRYLQKLEVLNLEVDEKPKFPLVRMKKDLHIVYGIKKKRRRRSSSSSQQTGLTESTTRRERTRKKKALAEAEYREHTIKSKTDGSSLQNETLTSLKDNSEKSSECEEIVFNKYVVKELRKSLSEDHLEVHQKDLDMNLKCHRINKLLSYAHRSSVHNLSPKKIYGILYLALLINKDPMQLGDLLRYLREGHLSLNSYASLFPEDYSNKNLNIKDNPVTHLYNSEIFRQTAGRLAKFLNVQKYICVPDLVALSRRYCQEMNLPVEISVAVENIIAENPPKFKPHKNIIPNYEGRVMSIIIFVLKLLYGLDGISEISLSNYAKAANRKWKHLKMFDIMEWLEFINYRKLILAERHFPSFIKENEGGMDSDLYVQYRKSHNINIAENRKLVVDMKGYKDLLTTIERLDYNSIPHIHFPSSLYPLTTHTEVILRLLRGTEDGEIDNCILEKNFQDCSLDFLLRPLPYLEKLNKDIQYKNGGMNDKWVLKKFETRHIAIKSFIGTPVELVLTEIVPKLTKKKNEIAEDTPDDVIAEIAQEEYNNYNYYKFQKNFLRLKELNVEEILNLETESDDIKSDYKVHCFPYERYWLNINIAVEFLNNNDFDAHFNNYNSNFKLIFQQCAKLIDQAIRVLYLEYQTTELYLVYNGKNYKDFKRRKKSNNLRIPRNQYFNYW